MRYDTADLIGMSPIVCQIEDAISSGHNILFVGPLGGAVSTVVLRIPGILPQLAMSATERLNSIYDKYGEPADFCPGDPPPIRWPHPSVNERQMARESALSEGGVIYLESINEFTGPVLEALAARPPRLIVGETLICPCGLEGLGRQDKPCKCTEPVRRIWREQTERAIRAFNFCVIRTTPYAITNVIAGNPDVDRSEVIRERIEKATEQRIRREGN